MARRVVFGGVERTMRLAFRLSRATRRRTVTRLNPTAGTVAVVAPHPDDETVGAGGVAALHALAGATVTIVVITDGGASRAGGIPRDTMVERRRRELEAAIRALGDCHAIQLGVPERLVDTPDVRARLEPLVSTADTIYAPSCVDFHPDHLAAARVVADIVRDEQIVRVYEIGVPLTPILVNAVAAIEPVADRKATAWGCFTSQQHNLEPLARLARYRTALYGTGAGEVFWEMSGRVYRRLMRHHTWSWLDTPFRGIRRSPFTDPLAFVLGRKARWRLAEAAQRFAMTSS